MQFLSGLKFFSIIFIFVLTGVTKSMSAAIISNSVTPDIRETTSRCVKEIRCKPLATISTTAICMHEDRVQSCVSSVPVNTTATLECRSGYRSDSTILSMQRKNVKCNALGQWHPEPIKCYPECGQIPSDITALMMNGDLPESTDFPWHATLYKSKTPDGDKKFICGATIIQSDLLITAAYCVFDKSANKVEDENKFAVVTGNLVHAFNSPLHDSKTVKKAKVKKIFVKHDYSGLLGNYARDIAIIQIDPPLTFSTILMPACLDIGEHSDRSVLEVGNYGKIAGFGPTAGPAGHLNQVLQSLRVPYVSFKECRASIVDPEYRKFLTDDKFCAGYKNGSSLCQGDTGGGLVFLTDSRWYLRGVASVGLEEIASGDTGICHGLWYSLYTKISNHVQWIQDVLLEIESSAENEDDQDLLADCYTCRDDQFRCNDNECIPSDAVCDGSPNCKDRSDERPILCERLNSMNYAAGTISGPAQKTPPCVVPLQPNNGRWRLHKSQCRHAQDCDVPSTVSQLRLGTHLVYNCDHGYKLINGTVDVFCSPEGKWSNEPQCQEIRCKSLMTAATKAECTYMNEPISCNSAMRLGTSATVSCQNGYHSDLTMTLIRSSEVRCKGSGEWDPEPIQCFPECGQIVDSYAPLIVEGQYPQLSHFPWHATLYKSKTPNGNKVFICGATIIQSDLLITAAHCVFNEKNERVEDANKFAVVTGNLLPDFDSPGHDPIVVKKANVTAIFLECNYLGYIARYSRDIAILRIDKPFRLSAHLMPACLCGPECNDKTVLEVGNSGVVAGFGRTKFANQSQVLQSLEIPYVATTECRKASNKRENRAYLSDDKFCGGYTNGSALCNGDSGGGLVFKTGDHWFLRGVVSSGLNWNDETNTCDPKSFTLFTRISSYIGWIQKTVHNLNNGILPTCL